MREPGSAATIRAMAADASINVLYVEDDPVLRTILADMVEGVEGVRVVATAADDDEAIAAMREHRIDVAMLDLALGARSLHGVDLALRLRTMKPRLGIVIVSQHLLPNFHASIPEAEQHSWSYIQKRGDLSGLELAQVVHATFEGKMVLDPSALDGRAVDTSALEQLSARQRSVLALLATGRDAIGIAEDLGLPHTTVRRDISNAYRVLVPDVGPGDDLRITAVLEYLRVTRPYDFEA